MARPTWQLEERRTLFVLKVVLGLTDEATHDIMGRIFGETWSNAIDPPRKKYKVHDLRDEVNFRWSAGKRHSHWNTIDPEDGPSDDEKRAQTATLGIIFSAAAQTNKVNWLLTNDTGNMTRQLNVIPIPDVASRPQYQRDPATFDRNFYTGERKAPKRKQESLESGPSKLPTTQGSVFDTANKANDPTKEQDTRPTFDLKDPNIQGTWKGWHVDMIHEKWYLEWRRRLDSGTPMTGDEVPEYIFEDGDIRKYGGQLVRIHNYSSPDKYEDALVCQSAVCDQCTAVNNFEDKRIANLIPGVETQDGPTKGLPFVHRERDVKTALGGFGDLVFIQAKDVEYHPLVLPERTKIYMLRCMVRNKQRDRCFEREVKVLGCIPEHCEVCNQELAKAKEAERVRNGEKRVQEAHEEEDGDGEDEASDEEEEQDDAHIFYAAKSDSEDSNYDERPKKKARGKPKKAPNRVVAGPDPPP
ncbi:hypothetical protein CERZMDRAFT_93412 [Cercospora zeae-maydis SCOH1-5]|uniref:Uncharacterized protein n=1 Tax=Cercospora zeae-maydis SCOH1-5 TaxID=717836 RepID=A0A6A6FVF0_9PEZI|nr:hypothetical protein CERZMDRAFT_93412 [Cercospora zeae-maydis SCOH1-5]